MPLLTDEELESIKDDHRDQLVDLSLLRAVEAAVLEKLKVQKPVAFEYHGRFSFAHIHENERSLYVL